MTRRIFKAASLLLASTAFLPSLAQAEDAVDLADQGLDASEIIVTAQKIEQRAIDVPMTISATSGEALERLGVSDLDELSNYVPGLNIQEQSANNPGIVIRGITSDSGSSQQAARVTLYYNGVDISRSRGAYQAIYDMDRIEVIKGPQATLFGTASAVGAVSLISKKPEPGFSAELTGGYGNYDATLLSGYINAGNDVIAGRIAGEWRKRDGYVKNLSDRQDDLYAQDQLGLRASLRFTPNDDLMIDLIGTYDRQRNSGTPFISGTYGTSAGPANPFGPANLSGAPREIGDAIFGDGKLGLVRDVYDINLSADWELGGGWTLSLVNGYREFDADEVFDADGTAAWFLEFAEEASGWQASQETRLAYSGDTLRASFGFNYFHEDSHQIVPFSSEEGTFLQCAAGVIAGLGCIAEDGSVAAAQATGLLTEGAASVIPYTSTFGNYGKNTTYSVFADATWIPVPELELTAGVRALWEDRESGYFADVPDTVLTGGPLIPSQVDTDGTIWADDSFDAILPRFNALYRISRRVNLYATISKGRRSPTLSVSATDIKVIPQETVWNYEGGIKFAGDMVSGSVGVYYQEYSNFQISRMVSDENDPSGLPVGSSITESAGSASNLGFEGDLQIRPSDWLTLFGNVGYIDGGIDDGESNGIYAGDRFRLQPEWQWAAGFSIDAPLSGGARFFATPSVTYRSKIYFEVPNSEVVSQGPVTLVNAKAGVSFADDQYKIAVFGRNITDEDYLLDAGNTGGAFGIPTFIPAEPRMYGVELTARF
ncbi:TonB-dependent receptor [Altericroceibacterium endophyticum]|uniref:TonB-dependent receptor n=1 Tax=Altericroceibacterium endophyticum TaxID=1808508 RepID=A0A6I4T602_9SPHN|nr:TonB-dependent receptor [Altericroceibacterium endophyticum]MXO65215.1 TonB-dependent receptor [Altericroceibacterium endophyticum]